ncbi:MAG: hypothetical protein QOE07_1362, partial [Acidimicrobiaceae bacterium]|nr:hypothetical protein [Acidimicrobiaceae bacterium]MDQ1442322.1 hypothetical protein [Acidimicrobiaceae bacterium]
PIYVCGEAYSMQQGWVQGALEHVELLLQRAFDVPP